MIQEKNNFKDYLQELDNQNLKKVKKEKRITKDDKLYTMIPMTFDFFFKSLFLKRLDYLKDFIISVLKLEIDYDDIILTIYNNELLKDNYKEYKKIVDLLISINNDIIINIEVNRRYYKDTKIRNDRYINKIYDMLIGKGQDYNELINKRIYQLNLNAREKNSKIKEDIIVSYGKISNKIYDNNTEIYLKYLEVYRSLYYNENNRERETVWLTLLTSRTYSETYEIMLNLYDAEKAKSFIEEVINLNSENYLIHEWEKEKLDALVAFNAQKRVREETEEKALKKGIKCGLKQGEKNIIISMLKNDMTYEEISKIVNKTVEEIKEIENSI